MSSGHLDFGWVLPGQLAGSACPGLYSDWESDLEYLVAQGIRLIVTLTEDPLESPVEGHGLRALHLPIPDMGVPTRPQAEEVCRVILESIRQSEPVLVHCKAGLGRTGTILACCLVRLGTEPDKAILEVRRRRPGSFQADVQLDFVRDFATEPEDARWELPRLRLS